MSTELLLVAQELFVWMLVLTLQITCILLLRKSLSRYFGATVAYRLWLLPLLWLPLHWIDWATINWSLPGNSFLTSDSPRGTVDWFPVMAQGMEVVLDLPESAFSPQSASQGLWLATAALWFGVALVLLAITVQRTRSFSRQLPRMAPSTSPGSGVSSNSPFPPTLPVRYITGLQSPALYGVLQPQLLLPEDFTQRFAPRQRALILAHEAVHYRRRDNFWNLVACCLRLLFWFNPLLHVAWHKFRLDQEMSCDEQALQQAGQDEGKQYARTLIESAVWTTEAAGIRYNDVLPTLTSWGRLSEIKERTRMIQHHLHNKPRSTAGKLFLPMLGVVILTLTASISGGLHEAVAAAPQESFRRAFRVTVERVIAYREAGEFSEAERLLNALEVMADSGELSDQETRAVRQFRVTQIAGQSQIDQQRMFSERVESLSNTALNSEGTDAQESDNEDEQAAEEYLPIVVIQPRYPTKALRENVEGWVSVSFTVNEAGSVEDPVVLESSPAGVFDEASLTAASRFKFNPRVVDGEAVQTPDVRYVFRFSVDE